jgi:hypothetical protein
VVFFAYERFTIVINPLKRIKFHSKKLSRFMICMIYAFSFLANCYTLVISGLREKETHEKSSDSLPSTESPSSAIQHLASTSLYECDTRKEYQTFYEYTVFGYVFLGIIFPIVLVCFFNVYIAKILLTRKKRMMRHLFQTLSELDDHSDQSHLQAKSMNGTQRSGENIKIITINAVRNGSSSSTPNSKKSVGEKSNSRGGGGGGADERKSSLEENNRNSKSAGESRHMIDSDSTSRIHKNNCSLVQCCKSTNSLANEDKAGDEKNGLKECHLSNDGIQKVIKMTTLTHNEEKSHQQQPSKFAHKSSTPNELMLPVTDGNKLAASSKSIQTSNNERYSTSLTQKLKDSGRATIILIIISTFFVLLNLPYIVAWTLFFIPFKYGKLTGANIHMRYSFVLLSEVLHVSNFSINFFLYYMASKIFRNRFLYTFSFFKRLQFKIRFFSGDSGD